MIGDRCLAISLHKADPVRFQIGNEMKMSIVKINIADVDEVEEAIMKEKGFLKMVIRLLKYLRYFIK